MTRANLSLAFWNASKTVETLEKRVAELRRSIRYCRLAYRFPPRKLPPLLSIANEEEEPEPRKAFDWWMMFMRRRTEPEDIVRNP